MYYFLTYITRASVMILMCVYIVCELLPFGADLMLDLSPRPITRLLRSIGEGNGIAHISFD